MYFANCAKKVLWSCRSAIFKHFVLLLLVVHFDANTFILLLKYMLNSGILPVRLRPHQNPLAADLRIPPIHFYGNAADFHSQRISAARGFLQSISMRMLRISAARGFWCARGLTEYFYIAVLILLLKQKYLTTFSTSLSVTCPKQTTCVMCIQYGANILVHKGLLEPAVVQVLRVCVN